MYSNAIYSMVGWTGRKPKNLLLQQCVDILFKIFHEKGLSRSKRVVVFKHGVVKY